MYSNMKILSYNVWFSEQHRILRLESLMAYIIAIDADVGMSSRGFTSSV